MLDVSEEGLCILSPVPLKPKQPVLVVIDVPLVGPVEAEAVAWHTRRVKSSRRGVKAWSIGMMIVKVGEGFQTLLPGENMGEVRDPLAGLHSSLREPPQAASQALSDTELEEDFLSAAELDDVDLELMSAAELDDLLPEPEQTGDGSLQMFRVRVKATRGPRTRMLTLGAVSAAEAETLASADLGDDWSIIEVLPA